MAEENSRGLFEVAANAEKRQEESERECREWVEELTLLQTWGSELCQSIVSCDRTTTEMRGLSPQDQLGILNEARIHKHTYESYKDMNKVEIKLLQLCLGITR
jgi:hypothetical protein